MRAGRDHVLSRGEQGPGSGGTVRRSGRPATAATISGPPVAFINVSDPDRAQSFYRDVLGFALRSAETFGDCNPLDGVLPRLTVRPDLLARPHPVLDWNVPGIVAAARSVRGRGATLTIYEGVGQDELGIRTSPDGQAEVASCADPDGNVLSISQA